MTREWPIVVRRARPDDKDAVLAFATSTWDGWDYIPHAWPVWMTSTDGVVLVACRPSDDVPLAITRVALVSPTEAWWEGIRVDPAVRGMEVAADLQVAELQWSAAQGANVVRYATSARNEGSHRLGARHGVELLFGYTNYWWSASPDDDPHEPSAFDAAVRAQATQVRGRVLDALAAQGRVAVAADAPRLWNFVSNDAGFQATQRLYEPRPWALGELTAARLARHLERGEVIELDGRALAIMSREQLAGEDSSLRLALLVGDVDGMLDLVAWVRSAAGERTIRFRLPEEGPAAEAAHEQLVAAGYRAGEWALHVLGRPIDAAHPVPGVDPSRLILADEPAAVLEPPW
jgi:hypothetical protein